MKERIKEIADKIKHYPLSDNSIDYAEKELLDELTWDWTFEVGRSLADLEKLYEEGIKFNPMEEGNTDQVNAWDKKYDDLMHNICDRSKRWYEKYVEEMTEHMRPILPFEKWVTATDEERAIFKESERFIMERELRFRLISKTLKVKELMWTEEESQITRMVGLREIQPYGMFHILVGDEKNEPDCGYEEIYGFIEDIRPILWPMSCLTKWVKVSGEKVCWLYEMKKHLFGPKKVESVQPSGDSVFIRFIDNSIEYLTPKHLSIDDVNFMYEHDIDCNGLIPKGLAISALEEKVYE